ncbi:MAG: hypothetical protein NWE89_03480 [Candidatus Bathyarchaeota archaeon]|nr:hypothetical protein [Candidatus Bathyarchaeota archaeon]
MKRIIITGWRTLLRCNECGNEHESGAYGMWSIDSSTPSPCQVCKKSTNHTVVGMIADVTDYDEYKAEV